jgi:tRNA nucleotidyltransferase/poly(A) polymerase
MRTSESVDQSQVAPPSHSAVGAIVEPQKAKKIDRAEFVNGVIAKLSYFAQLYGVKSLFVVGGYCRCLYFNNVDEVNDIDVASAYEHQAVQLAGLFASEVLKTAPQIYERSQAAMVEYKEKGQSIKIEFQGKSPSPYMYNQEIRDWLHNQKIEDEPIMHNIYGRDFTINSLMMSLSSGEFYDLTGKGARDLESKAIVSLLPPPLLIKYNPLAALRAIRFSVLYDFSIDDQLKETIRKSYPFITSSLSEERVAKEIVRILTVDAAKGIDQLKEFNLDRLLLIPLVRNKVREESDD